MFLWHTIYISYCLRDRVLDLTLNPVQPELFHRHPSETVLRLRGHSSRLQRDTEDQPGERLLAGLERRGTGPAWAAGSVSK